MLKTDGTLGNGILGKRGGAAVAALSAALLVGCKSENLGVGVNSERPAPANTRSSLAPSLERQLQDEVTLRERAAAWTPQHDDQLARMSPRDHLLNMVAISSFRQSLDRSEIETLRKGIAIARAATTDPYERSLIDLYTVLPLKPLGYGMFYAPDAEHLIRLKNEYSGSLLLPNRYYRPETKELDVLLSRYLRGVASDAELEARAAQPSGSKASPFFEAIFAREGTPPAVEKRARDALAQIMPDMRAILEEQRAKHGGAIDAAALFSALHGYLRNKFGVIEAAQASIAAGLATRTFDCDVYTLVLCEFGKQVGLPIDAFYLIDTSKPTAISHVVPVAVLRNGKKTSYVAFECREAIEISAGGEERRIYKSYEEMPARINRLAGEDLFGPFTIICLLTDEAKVKLLHPYGTVPFADLTSKEMKIVFGKIPDQSAAKETNTK